MKDNLLTYEEITYYANKFEDLCNEKDKEIERLNNIIKLQDTRNSRQRIANRKILERNQDLVIENLKLNNIITELEKWLEEQHQFIIEIPAYTKEKSIEHKTMEICYENVLDKLQELKGSNKE